MVPSHFLPMIAESMTLPSGGESTITISVKWPYDSGDDEKDTYWGRLAYDFHNTNPNSPSIKLVVKITAIQK